MLDRERVQADVKSAHDHAISESRNAAASVETPDYNEDIDMDMAMLMEESMSSEIESGQIVTGSVLKVTSEDVVVDIGSKSEGVIPLREFLEDGKDPNVFVGMDVDVMVISREGRDGLPILSRQKAKERKARDMVRDAFKDGTSVRCVVRSILRGGFQVDVDGLRGFIPFSQMGPGARTPEDQKALIGQTIEAKILEMRRKRDLILSQRQYIEERREALRQETMESLQTGNWVRGIVKNLTDFGAFVDLGGVDGLLHVNDMSWGHVNHPREVVGVGNEIEVMVLNMEGERISLGLKQKYPDPWLRVQEKFPPATVHGGKVTSLTKYGAFVGLEEGVEGLIHISEMSWTKRVNHPSEILKQGEEVRVKVLSIDMERKRISLSLRQTTVDPWTLAKANYPPGSEIEGEVTGMTDFGAFVRLPEGVDGMIHVSDLSWGEKINHPKQVLKKGEKIRVKVLEIDPLQQRISLGLKQLEPDPWNAAAKKYKVGTAVEVKVTRMTEFGAFVELEQGMEGLAHSSTLVTEKGQRPEDVLRVGDIVVMKIVKFDKENRKISLSLKDFIKEQEAEEVKKYLTSESGGNATLGELLGEQMHRLMQKKKQAAAEADMPRAEEPPIVEASPEAQEPAAIEPEMPVQPQEPAAIEPEMPVQPQESAAIEPEMPVQPQEPAAIEPEMSVQPQEPATIEPEMSVQPEEPAAIEPEMSVQPQEPAAVEPEIQITPEEPTALESMEEPAPSEPMETPAEEVNVSVSEEPKEMASEEELRQE
ncbi:MAG: 30S ribosomal protein S1 [Candidatus Omnitrophota bacterium]